MNSDANFWHKFGLVCWVVLMCGLQLVHATDLPPSLVERGAYLARAGNCLGCHSSMGGDAYAGGRGIETPFGVVYASNLTPDVQTGLGSWSSSDFWQAMHHGRSKDGRLLNPAFPYSQLTLLKREDSDAIFYFLRSLKPIHRPNTPNALRFPYNTQAALMVWRALFFTPAQHQHNQAKSESWNQGSYLVNGLAHCAACHSSRNFLGAISAGSQFKGGLMPDRKWYAPSLLSIQEASVAKWSDADTLDLLQKGVSKSGWVSGPMATVVFDSTQHLSQSDLIAMVSYLKDLPQVQTHGVAVLPANPQVMLRGEKIYEKHCAGCHGEKGQGVADVYPALSSNRLVSMRPVVNLLRVVERGGFAPATTRHPRPFGMPPFGQILSQREMADLLSFIRQSWGNSAAELSELDVLQAR